MEQLLKEAKELAEGGVKELILVAQETTVYGQDLYGEKSLPRLLEGTVQDSGYPVDPASVLLSGRDYDDESDSGDEGRTEDLSLSGSANPACK